MASSVTPLRLPVPLPVNPLRRVRDLVLELTADTPADQVPFHDMCFYRFDQPAVVNKAVTFGVTLGVVLQGTKHIRIEGHDLAVDPSTLLVITRDVEHDIRVTTGGPDRPYLGLALCFGPERVARALLAVAEAGAPPVTESVPAFIQPVDDDIAGAIERLLRAQRDPLDRKLLAPLAIDEILFRLLRSDAAAAVRRGVGHAADAARIVSTMQLMRERHTEKLSVEALARHAAMSPSHFAHRFSSVARVSPMKFLREVRLERARSLLVADGARAGEVASLVGFESAAHFTREFKRRFGVPPSHYLRTRVQ
ncbi:MAG TPA: AraC family transcriptional regulator [Kofleriaceae bacterium]|nr:AraC family transcriptional regulator [Kofleriaceae bacterium]